MKVVCNTRKLSEAFGLAASVAPSRTPKEILQNVKLFTEGDNIKLVATDSEIAIEVQVDDVEVKGSGAVLLPVFRMAAIIRETTSETVAIETDGEKILIRADRSKFHLMSQNPDEFPAFTNKAVGACHELTARSLAALIRRTVFATDDDSARYALGGISIEADESRLTAVGTDGRRLAVCDSIATSVGGHVAAEGKTVIPSRAAKLIERALNLHPDDIVRVVASMNDIVIATPECVIASRLVEGRYPTWRNVFPKLESPSTINVLNGLFLSAVRQAAIATSKESRGIEIGFWDGEIRMEATAPEVGESSVTMFAETDLESQGIKLKIDHQYIREFCNVLEMDELLTITVQDSKTAMIIEAAGGYRYVLMPMAMER